MKNKLTTLTVASMLAISNISAIEIGPTGSGIDLSGFVDIGASKQGSDTESTKAQVELNFGYTMGPVSAAVGLDFGESSVYGDQTPNNNLEEAYITYDFGNGLSVTGGRMLSYMGFEAFDPTNMYQFSYAYDVGGATLTGETDATGAQMIYDAYDTGASIDYGNDLFSVGVWASLENEAGYELALAYTGIENFTAKAIYSDFSAPALKAYEKSTYWVSYQLDKLLIAGEIAENDQLDTGYDVDGMLVMANYALSDKVGLTFRYSEMEITGATNSTVEYEGTKFTFSPSYIFTDNLSGLLEYSSYTKDSGNIAEPGDLIAAEVIFTF
jgi:hypothetical protein|tara:strand:+ start:133 stop:1110 length:978 start_codon:yes stop_codon:yes gene_type:complete